MGTALLLICYSSITIAEILNTFGLWYFAFISEESILSEIFELAFVLFYAAGYLFLYFFANRHILRDNDIVKGITTIILSLIVGLIFGIMVGEAIYKVENSIFSMTFLMEGVNINQTLPTILGGSILLVPIFLTIHLRIVIKILSLRKTLDKGITKTSFTTVLLSIIFFIVSTLFATAFTIPGIGEHPYIIVTFHTLRTLSVMCSLFLGFLGWIRPYWFKEIIAKKYNIPIEEE